LFRTTGDLGNQGFGSFDRRLQRRRADVADGEEVLALRLVHLLARHPERPVLQRQFLALGTQLFVGRTLRLGQTGHLFEILFRVGTVEPGAFANPRFDAGDHFVGQRRRAHRHPLAVRRAFQFLDQQAVARPPRHHAGACVATLHQAGERHQIIAPAGLPSAAVAIAALLGEHRGQIGRKADLASCVGRSRSRFLARCRSGAERLQRGQVDPLQLQQGVRLAQAAVNGLQARQHLRIAAGCQCLAFALHLADNLAALGEPALGKQPGSLGNRVVQLFDLLPLSGRNRPGRGVEQQRGGQTDRADQQLADSCVIHAAPRHRSGQTKKKIGCRPVSPPIHR
jgi:hypothetical protein